MHGSVDRGVAGLVGAGYVALVVAAIGTFVADHATPYAWTGSAAALASLGRLAGLSAGLLMIGLFVLVGRWPPLERAVGQDRLLRWHTAVAIVLPCVVLVHATLVVLGGSALMAEPALGYVGSLVQLSVTVLLAIGAAVVLVGVAVTSTRWVRGRLRYEWWHTLHVTVYLALAGALLHQVVLGTDLSRHPLLRAAWVAAVVAVLGAALTFRLAAPVVRSLAAGVRVAAVVPESPRVWSLLLEGDRLAERVGEGGVFCCLRVLRSGMWAQAHPFSVSGLDPYGRVRFTFGADGDFTAALTTVVPGTRVVLEGPYGRFRASRAHSRGPYLLVGAGSGVGAVVGVARGLPRQGRPPALVQRVRAAEDVLFAHELQRLVDEGQLVHHVVTGSRDSARPRLDDPDALRTLVPDIGSREVYLCGPDELTRRLAAAVRACGVPQRLVHVERFALGGRHVAAPAAHAVPSAATPVRRAAPARRAP